MANEIRVDYEVVKIVAGAFVGFAEDVKNILIRLRVSVDALQGGGWTSCGATAFYTEMNERLMPSLSRLENALRSTHRVMLQIMDVYALAEREAEKLFVVNGDGSTFDPWGPFMVLPMLRRYLRGLCIGQGHRGLIPMMAIASHLTRILRAGFAVKVQSLM